MNGRIFERKKNALIFQPRDAEILKSVFRYRFLIGEQIKSLCGFSSQKRTNDRLRKLFDNRFLSRRLFINGFDKEVLYFLGPKSIEFISAQTGIDPLKVKRKRTKSLKARDSFLFHLLFINNFRYCLETAKGFNPKAGIETWKYKPALFSNEEKKIFPDAYFRIKHQEKDYNFFLEIDHSTESGKRIKKKVESYLDYGLSGDFEKQFGFTYFRLLIVSKTLVRLKSLLRTIEKVTDKSFFWLTIEKNISPEKISDKIWSRSNANGLFSLLE